MQQDPETKFQKLVKPNCTIALRHNRILDQMASDHYVSRSEALRACIIDHERTLDGDSEDSIKLLHEKVNSQSKQLDELSDSIESLLTVIVRPELQRNSLRHWRDNPNTPHPTGQVSEADVVPQKHSTDAAIVVDEDVYNSISKLREATIPEISNHCGRPESEVHDSVKRLDARYLISSYLLDGVTEYQLSTGIKANQKIAEETDEC